MGAAILMLLLQVEPLTILQQNCGNAGCHGGASAYSFDVFSPASLEAAGVVQPGKANSSELIRRLEAGEMPLGGYKGQRGAKLPPEYIKTLKEWIDAGARPPAVSASAARRFIPEREIIKAIENDLDAAPPNDRWFRRYF